MQKKVIIIGAGLAGLTAGCYALMNGLAVEIFEKNTYAGGLSASWKQGDYNFESGTPLLWGTSKKSNLHNIWDDLTLNKDIEIIYPKELNSFIQSDGRIFHAYSDLELLKNEMLAYSPEDKDLILNLIKDIKVISNFTWPLIFSWTSLKSSLLVRKLRRKYRIPPWKYALSFKNKALAEIFTKIFNDYDQSLFLSLFILGALSKNNAGYPSMGAHNICRILENKFITLGGKIHFSSQVSKVLIKKNKACGVILNTGEEIKSDSVISCADGHRTLFEWIDKKYLTLRIKEIYKKLETFPSILYLNLGINHDFSHLPIKFVLTFPEGILVDVSRIDHLTILNQTNKGNYLPPGNSIFSIIIPTNWSVWKYWEKNPNEYANKKNQVIQNCISALLKHFPEIEGKIEAIDLATPCTFERFSGNWKSSIDGFLFKEKKQRTRIPQELPYLQNFYMAGHWTGIGGGILMSSLSARNAVQKLCHELRVPFKT